LVYEHEAVLPWELKSGPRRTSLQDELIADEYTCLMKDGLEDLAYHRLRALINVEANKARIARWYDKKVKVKEFSKGDLVWKLILPIASRDQKYGKWSPTWEGPYRINRCVPWQCLYFGNTRGRRVFPSFERQISEEILS
jgi:hypothetical protein